MSDTYAVPEVVVSTQWVADHLTDPGIRIAESDEDILLYDKGHIPGSIKLDWQADLQNTVSRDFIGKQQFNDLMSRSGISNETLVVFYGDRNNWYACYTFWLFAYYGHHRCAVMNGGRTLWEKEQRPLTRQVPTMTPTVYSAHDADGSIRAYRDRVMQFVGAPAGKALVDVRSPEEYSGKMLHMLNYPQEGAQRAGHIPGARSIPWAMAANPDGTFKSVAELRDLYTGQGITPDKEIVSYCRIGERSSHTWFVLKYLLGYPCVQNYDGSWTEWGSMVGVPIEK